MVKGFCRDKRNYIVIITKGNSLVLLRTITQLARFTSMKHMCHFWSNMNPSCFYVSLTYASLYRAYVFQLKTSFYTVFLES